MSATELTFDIRPAREGAPYMQDILDLLHKGGLDMDAGVEVFVTANLGSKMVGCAGLDHNIIKCVTIAPEMRSERKSPQLITRIIDIAAERGYYHLFLYTKPDNESFFRGCGFYPIATVPGFATLMENTPIGISRYCDSLKKLRKDGNKIGSIVVNANPFTLGHRYLVEQSAEQCDWLHVFVVREDLSMFSYNDRLRLVRQGIENIPNVTVHEGSCYMISKATFPTYFIKEKSDVQKVSTGLDLLIFRNHIAPALGVTHRFVGTEPFCQITKGYNDDMQYWLQEAPADGPAIKVVELERCTSADKSVIISASAVRAALRKQEFNKIRTMVPKTTYDFLVEKYQKPAA